MQVVFRVGVGIQEIESSLRVMLILYSLSSAKVSTVLDGHSDWEAGI